MEQHRVFTWGSGAPMATLLPIIYSLERIRKYQVVATVYSLLLRTSRPRPINDVT